MPIVFGAVSRAQHAEKRSMAFGVAMALGSLGPFAMLPSALRLIESPRWAQTLVPMSTLASLMLPLAFGGVVQRMDTRHLLDRAGLKADGGHGGAVTLFQRFDSAGSLNTHLHCLVPDAVYR